MIILTHFAYSLIPFRWQIGCSFVTLFLYLYIFPTIKHNKAHTYWWHFYLEELVYFDIDFINLLSSADDDNVCNASPYIKGKSSTLSAISILLELSTVWHQHQEPTNDGFDTMISFPSMNKWLDWTVPLSFLNEFKCLLW